MPKLDLLLNAFCQEKAVEYKQICLSVGLFRLMKIKTHINVFEVDLNKSPNYLQLTFFFLLHQAKQTCVSLNSSSSHLISGGLDNTVNIWDLKSRKIYRSLKVSLLRKKCSFPLPGFAASCKKYAFSKSGVCRIKVTDRSQHTSGSCSSLCSLCAVNSKFNKHL